MEDITLPMASLSKDPLLQLCQCKDNGLLLNKGLGAGP